MKLPLHFRASPWRLCALGLAPFAPIAGLMAASTDAASDVNLAVVAAPSTSYVSGDTSLEALQDDLKPRNSRDRRRGSYGNWPTTGTQWVQYDWSQPIRTRRIAVYWWADGRGVHPPRASRLLFWDGQAFVPVPGAGEIGVAVDQFNELAFGEVETTKLRIEIDSDGRWSTGMLEWKVFDSGASPNFPPRVDAGVDRVVVVGSRTWLNGAVQTLKGKTDAPVAIEWTQRSGPGEVSLAAAGELSTTATFSTEGDYELALTARQGSLNGAASVGVKVVAPAPETPFEVVETRAYRIDSPLWWGRARALIVDWIPHCIRQIEDPDLREGGLNNFLEAAKKLTGQPAGEHRGYVFSNAWVFNTIEAICRALEVDPSGDPEVVAAQTALRATLEEWIPIILAAQEPDGYLQTAYTLSDRERWSPRYRGDHEGYVAGYFLDAAVAHYRYTDGADARLYAAARRLADCWDQHIGPAPKQEWFDGHQAIEMALMNLGRLVNEVDGAGQGDRYVRLAKFLLDCRRNGSEYDQSHLPVVQQYEAVGHAVRAVYNYAAMADVVLELGDRDYESAVESLWDNLVNRKYYVTGGVGSGETSEGFGPDFSLPHGGYCESCSSCGEIFFQHRMNRIHRHARYADLLEETLYNALLGSVDLAGKNFYYQNPLDERRPRYPWHGCPCCVGNIPRTLLSLPTWIYAKEPEGVYVNLFLGSTVRVEDVGGTNLKLIQRTDHPWGGGVRLTVNPEKPARFSVHIRVPNRQVSELYTAQPPADGLRALSVNGRPVEPEIVNGYAMITREWQPGDRVDFTLPMPVQMVRGDSRVAATRGQVALRYGPLIYCVETVDQPIGEAVDLRSEFVPEWRGDLLDGVSVLRGHWQNGASLTAIPYYARFNRPPPAPAEASARREGDQRAAVWLRAP